MKEKPENTGVRNARSRGGIVLWVSVVIITLACVTGAVFWLLQSQSQQQKMSHRKADEISDYGLIVALDTINKNPSWTGPINKTPYDGGVYEVTLSRITDADSILVNIEARGTFGSQTQKKHCVLVRASADSSGPWTRRELE
jgi:hypothetical protein